jgi:hypothetical protein
MIETTEKIIDKEGLLFLYAMVEAMGRAKKRSGRQRNQMAMGFGPVADAAAPITTNSGIVTTNNGAAKIQAIQSDTLAALWPETGCVFGIRR